MDRCRGLWLIALAAAAGEIGQEEEEEGNRRQQIYVMNIQIGDSPMESSSTHIVPLHHIY